MNREVAESIIGTAQTKECTTTEKQSYTSKYSVSVNIEKPDF